MPTQPSLVRAWRNNNPLNVRPLPKGELWAGQCGIDDNGSASGYSRFPRPLFGWLAGYTLLRNYKLLHGLNTVRGVCYRWAPPSDNNPTSAYTNTVCALVGVGPDQRIDLTSRDTLRAMGDAMSIMEGGHLPWADGEKIEALARMSPVRLSSPPPAPPPVCVEPEPAIDTSVHADDNVSDDLNQRELDRLHGGSV